jgi:hypothetical protein
MKQQTCLSLCFLTQPSQKLGCEMRRVFLTLILSFSFLSISQGGVVKKGVTWSAALGGNDHQYYLVEFPYNSWGNAVVDLFSTVGPGHYLATITSQAEQDFLLNYLLASTVPGVNYYGEYWLGGYQFPVNTPGKNDNWVWMTNEPWNYSNWLPNEPNDYGGPGTEQHLGIRYHPGYKGWNDEGYYHNIRGYIVESVPEPTIFLLLATGLSGLGFVSRMKKQA